MLFSIIIPCYNVEAFLAECLDSVVSQSYTDWEAISVDDGSTDGTAAIQADYAARDSRIHVISQPNGGLSAARNAGLLHASGDYVLFLDSDDVLTPNALEVLANQIKNTQAEVITFNAELWYYQENRFAPHYYSRNEYALHDSGIDYLVAFVREHRWGPAAACFYCVSRDVVVENEVWFVPRLLHEDELWVPLMLVASKGKVAEIAQTLYLYRMREQSIMHNVSSKNAQDIFYIAETLERELTHVKLPHDVRNCIVYNNAKIGIQALLGQREKVKCSHFHLAWRNATWKRKIKLVKLIILGK